MEAVCQKLEVSPPTYHRGRQEYGGAKQETVKRLKALEQENTQLKKLVADLSLDKAMLKELVEGKWQARRANARRWHTLGGDAGRQRRRRGAISRKVVRQQQRDMQRIQDAQRGR